MDAHVYGKPSFRNGKYGGCKHPCYQAQSIFLQKKNPIYYANHILKKKNKQIINNGRL